MRVSNPVRSKPTTQNRAANTAATASPPFHLPLRLDYRLKGGGTLSRRYTLWLDPDEMDREGTAAWAVQQFYDNRELYWGVYGFARLEEGLV